MRGLRGLRIGLNGMFTVDPVVAGYDVSSSGQGPGNSSATMLYPPSVIGSHPGGLGPPWEPELPPGVPARGKPTDAGQLPPDSARKSYEEGLAQFFLRRLQTPAGDNLLSNPDSGRIGFPPNAFSASGALRVIKDPAIDMPASGEPFDFDKVQGATPAPTFAPAAPGRVVVVQFLVPNRKNGTIKWMANTIVGGPSWDGSGAAYWQILADGLPIAYYEQMLSSRGTPQAPGSLVPNFIRITQGQLIQLVLVNVTLIVGPKVPAVGLLRGHFYPIELEPSGGATWM